MSTTFSVIVPIYKVEKYLNMQPPLKAPFPKPDNREQFWSDFKNKSFEYVAKKYGGIGLKNDAKLLLRKIKRKIKKLVVKGGKRDSNII